MAENAARVSPDGEAVQTAKVVAAMVSAAFIEKDMSRLLDIDTALNLDQDHVAHSRDRFIRSFNLHGFS
jgi:hypothetical protein